MSNFLLIPFLLITVVFLAAVAIRERQERENQENKSFDQEESFLTTCKGCHTTFKWVESDALIKLDYKSKFIISCPK